MPCVKLNDYKSSGRRTNSAVILPSFKHGLILMIRVSLKVPGRNMAQPVFEVRDGARKVDFSPFKGLARKSD
jgi:hypothetical protein